VLIFGWRERKEHNSIEEYKKEKAQEEKKITQVNHNVTHK